ncbi:oxidoreductase [Polaribacter aestuariivivens]|uniref:Oxidoreductase n=1 Tax=Polaribacter aestuariivivens TaxID=2304626 RepID=A0A5S3NC40_9FLAO|nr:oxidoreductase [Polaribacter aestuariivivens]TMM31179.1 oxidoreductase [Polaribacter aestuariivivens]
MKKLLFISLIFLISCKNEYQPRNIDSITIKEFKMDSTSIRAIQVVDSASVFYAGSRGDVGFTTNNGVLWNSLFIKHQDSIIPQFRSLAFNGAEYFALSIANPALLYKISEGNSTLVYKEENEKVFYDALTFFDDNLHGIAVGDPTENCASILLTSDGGETWNKIPCENLPEIAKDEAFFAASNTNIATIGSTVWIASGGGKANILKSTNYGKSWQIFSTPFVQGDGPQGIYSIDFYDQNNGIAVGGNYAKPKENIANKAITNDGGKTWTIVADGQSPNYKSCVQYVPNTNGKEVFAVGKTGVSFSNDGGKTWKDVSEDSYYTIQFVDANNAWLSGHQKIGKLKL